MKKDERHQYILKRLNEQDYIGVSELSSVTNVSEVTIRKDLQSMEEQNLLYRTYGGASNKYLYANERSLDEKEQLHTDKKRRIAEEALTLLRAYDSIIIASGTTVYTLAQILTTNRNLTVITPALKVGLELSNKPNIEVLQLGGLIRKNSSSVAGHYAESILDEISCGIFFLGVDGISIKNGFTITNLPEAKLNQKMMEISEVTVVLADSSKFEKRGLSKVCDIDKVQYLITDKDAPASTVKAIRDLGVTVRLV